MTSREFDEQVKSIARERSLKLETRCTGYYLYMDTGKPDGISQTIKKSFGMSHKTKLVHVLYLDKYGIELEHPELPGMPEALEEIGSRLYGITV